MSFFIRRPFAVSASIKQLPKSTNTAVRFFHQNGPFKQTTKKSPFQQARQSFQGAFKRTYIEPTYRVKQGSSENLTQKLLYGAAIVGGTVAITNLIFNRETREDGGMPPYERSYLNQTFLHTGLGVGIIGVAARALHTSGWSYRLMAMNPWMVIGVSLVGSIGTMYGTLYTSPNK